MRSCPPYRITLEAPPEEVSDSSQGVPRWATQIVLSGQAPPSEADVPDPSPWRSRILSVAFATPRRRQSGRGPPHDDRRRLRHHPQTAL